MFPLVATVDTVLVAPRVRAVDKVIAIIISFIIALIESPSGSGVGVGVGVGAG